MQFCSTARIEDVVQHYCRPLTGYQELPKPRLPPDLVRRIVDDSGAGVCLGPGQLLPGRRVNVGLLARKFHHLVSPSLEGLERPILLPLLLVPLELLADRPDVGPAPEPEAALLAPHDLGDALVPHVVQRHLLTSEIDLHFPAVVIPREADMHWLVEVPQQVYEHLHRVRVGELDALFDLAVVDRGEVYSPALVLQNLPIKVLDRHDQADVVLAFCDAALSRSTERLRTVVVHLEVQPGHAGEGVVHLVAPARDVRGVLTAKEALHLLDGRLIHGTRGSLTNGIMRVDVKGRRCGNQSARPEEVSSTS
mmetsp:Transcript_6147/g.16370  ORF Transcript_6147/g.16370 Transcript_6147/m.16370 type:complete len:308 (+) Transcript_6147:422-1345(+)